MRYFIELSYNGTNYCGWQIQPSEMSIQQKIEETISTILRTKTPIVGCGRTDSGVHASQYFLHFEHSAPLPDNFMNRANKILPGDIAFYQLQKVSDGAHTRFDASRRAYQYHISFRKDPFQQQTIYYFPQWEKLDIDKMQEAASLLRAYSAFYTFCKSNTEVKTMNCDLMDSHWEIHADGNGLTYHIAANRFLRGMVRLIVGMCLNVGMGKLNIDTVRQALDAQERLTKSLSAPPHGLFLTEVEYPVQGSVLNNE